MLKRVTVFSVAYNKVDCMGTVAYNKRTAATHHYHRGMVTLSIVVMIFFLKKKNYLLTSWLRIIIQVSIFRSLDVAFHIRA